MTKKKTQRKAKRKTTRSEPEDKGFHQGECRLMPLKIPNDVRIKGWRVEVYGP